MTFAIDYIEEQVLIELSRIQRLAMRKVSVECLSKTS